MCHFSKMEVKIFQLISIFSVKHIFLCDTKYHQYKVYCNDGFFMTDYFLNITIKQHLQEMSNDTHSVYNLSMKQNIKFCNIISNSLTRDEITAQESMLHSNA